MRRSWTAYIGDIGEAKAVYEFTKRGIPVLMPNTINIQYDLVIDCLGALFKVQVKTCEKIVDGAIKFDVTHCSDFNTHYSYSKEDTDLIFFYCVEADICCMMTIEELQGRGSIVFRTSIPVNNITKRINFTKDYTIDACLDRMGYTVV